MYTKDSLRSRTVFPGYDPDFGATGHAPSADPGHETAHQLGRWPPPISCRGLWPRTANPRQPSCPAGLSAGRCGPLPQHAALDSSNRHPCPSQNLGGLQWGQAIKRVALASFHQRFCVQLPAEKGILPADLREQTILTIRREFESQKQH